MCIDWGNKYPRVPHSRNFKPFLKEQDLRFPPGSQPRLKTTFEQIMSRKYTDSHKWCTSNLGSQVWGNPAGRISQWVGALQCRARGTDEPNSCWRAGFYYCRHAGLNIWICILWVPWLKLAGESRVTANRCLQSNDKCIPTCIVRR